ncbi:DoxX family protein [Micromonospora echinospora]|uniref:DoxX family protein n=1 Tax=Micromonospora echinospora TaxID=1877 RepID=A0ABR6ME37_MICEC|nr:MULTISPECIES: DoxX family protein [Micromonospora]AXO37169.1 hypothetical protein MicB006_4907 [Micromonospora sp. B006]MBB5112627.1 hypothetical protein [Micromonospora echinospora]
MSVVDTTPPPVARGLHRTLWVLQGFLGVFFIVASAGPKLFGEANAVQSFEDMGTAPWFRYLVGLALLMIGAAVTQAFILDGGALVLTPVVLFVLFVFIAWGRRDSIGRLLRR